ncbi:MAG: MoaD/ThiS family protein [Promethearchaeota archaeon]
MVNVTLKLMTIFSTDVGLTQIDYSDVNKLSDVIDQFMEKHGKKLRKNFVNSQGKLESHVVILVNGRNYLFLEELNTKLKEGDIIVISPPLIGG